MAYVTDSKLNLAQSSTNDHANYVDYIGKRELLFLWRSYIIMLNNIHHAFTLHQIMSKYSALIISYNYTQRFSWCRRFLCSRVTFIG